MRWLALVCLLGGCDKVFLKQRADAGVTIDSPDAPPDAFDSVVCPSPDYQPLSTLASRYKFVMVDDDYAAHASRCLLDTQGLTHLVVIESVQEAFAIDQQLDMIGGSMSFWIGLEQDSNALVATDGWKWVTGLPLDPAAWRASEPNDGNMPIVENHEEDRGMMNRFGDGVRFVLDAPKGTGLFAICECDGIDVR